VAAAAAPRRSRKENGSVPQVLNVIEQNFAYNVGTDKTIYKGSFREIRSDLDPHSNFFVHGNSM